MYAHIHTNLQGPTSTQSDRGSVHMKCHITKCLSFQTRFLFQRSGCPIVSVTFRSCMHTNAESLTGVCPSGGCETGRNLKGKHVTLSLPLFFCGFRPGSGCFQSLACQIDRFDVKACILTKQTEGQRRARIISSKTQVRRVRPQAWDEGVTLDGCQWSS